MKKRKMITILVLAFAAMLVFTSCANPSAAPSESAAPASSAAESAAPASSAAESPAAPASSDASAVSGKVQMSGSTSMEKVANALAEAFMEKNPDVTVDVQLGGSSVGITDVIAGKVDIGNASRELKEEEISQGAVPNVIAIDGIAMIVNPNNEAAGLTKDQLIQIYTGEVTNWKDVGGADAPIVVIGREAASGTRGAFEELLELQDKCKYAQELNESGAVITAVANTEGAIGYVSLDLVDDTVKALKLDDVEATEEQILAGNYILSRPFIMATKGELTNPTAKAFLDYVMSADGGAVIKDAGLILPK
jgi:phosphate transport system substrate-binding protein